MQHRKKQGLAALLAGAFLLPFLLVSAGADAPLNEGEAAALADFIAGEAGDEPYAVQLALAAVLLNRRSDRRYPDTVSGILTLAGYRWRGRTSVPDAARSAVWAAAEGMDITDGATAFARANSAAAHRMTVTFSLGDFVFGKE